MAQPKNDHHSDPLFVLLRLGQRVQKINQTLEDKTGISLTQWSLLKLLIEHPLMPVLSLAEVAEIQPGTLTQTLKRLQIKKFILVTSDPLDARRKLISVTRSGYTTFQMAEDSIAAWRTSMAPYESLLRRVGRELEHIS